MDKKERRKRKICVLIFVAIAVLIVITDLLLFWSSLQEEGIGSGLSRFF
jgi:flagellar basal body-associated protein FliL